MNAGTRVTFAAMRGDHKVTVSGVVADSHLTRWSAAWRTIRVNNGTVVEVMMRNLEVAS